MVGYVIPFETWLAWEPMPSATTTTYCCAVQLYIIADKLAIYGMTIMVEMGICKELFAYTTCLFGEAFHYRNQVGWYNIPGSTGTLIDDILPPRAGSDVMSWASISSLLMRQTAGGGWFLVKIKVNVATWCFAALYTGCWFWHTMHADYAAGFISGSLCTVVQQAMSQVQTCSVTTELVYIFWWRASIEMDGGWFFTGCRRLELSIQREKHANILINRCIQPARRCWFTIIRLFFGGDARNIALKNRAQGRAPYQKL